MHFSSSPRDAAAAGTTGRATLERGDLAGEPIWPAQIWDSLPWGESRITASPARPAPSTANFEFQVARQRKGPIRMAGKQFDKAAVMAALSEFHDPETGRIVAETGQVRDVAVDGQSLR